MLYQGKLIAVGTKEEFQKAPNPRIRQFLDRVPDRLVNTAPIEKYLDQYLEGSAK